VENKKVEDNQEDMETDEDYGGGVFIEPLF